MNYRVVRMRRIGIVASGSTVLDAGVILAKGEERNITAVKAIVNFSYKPFPAHFAWKIRLFFF